MRRLRLLNRILFVIGIVVVVYGLSKNPFIPYQDPTPELTQKFNEETALFESITAYGFGICMISLCLFIILGMARKK